MENLIQQKRNEKVLNPESFSKGAMLQLPLFDQAHPPAILGPTIKIPVVSAYWDVCEDCGTIYCTSFEYIEQPAQVQTRPQSPMRNPWKDDYSRKKGNGFN